MYTDTSSELRLANDNQAIQYVDSMYLQVGHCTSPHFQSPSDMESFYTINTDSDDLDSISPWIPDSITSFYRSSVINCISLDSVSSQAHLAHSKRHHFINIPIQGNPVKEYTHSARILSREYNYPIADASAVTTTGVQVLHQASTDYYTRSVSQDSVDGSPPVLRASSVDRYYTTQDVVVPSTTNISPLFSNSADMSLALNSNCDEPPSSHQGVRIKVLGPIYKDPTLLDGYKEEKRCRETAMLLRNGIETNLLGRKEE